MFQLNEELETATPLLINENGNLGLTPFIGDLIADCRQRCLDDDTCTGFELVMEPEYAGEDPSC